MRSIFWKYRKYRGEILKNRGLEYIKNMQQYFQPKTPYAALRAVEEGLLPAEAFIFKATSVEPVIDNQENLAEIERILGQKDRDLETNLLLMEILNNLIKNPDKEIALFAAESINAIENTYNRTIEALDKKDHRRRAELYMEMAELNRASEDLKNFYLREAFTACRELDKSGTAEESDLLLMCRILIQLGLPAQAKNILADNKIEGTEAGFILADIAFRQRNYTQLYEIISELDKDRSKLDLNQIEITDFWTDKG